MTAVVTCVDDADIVSCLSLRFGISITYARSIVQIVETLKALGISDRDILTGDCDYFNALYVSNCGRLKGGDKRDIKRAVAYYRMYHGVSADDIISNITKARKPHKIDLPDEVLAEREKFLSWFTTRRASIERGQTFFRDICRLRDFGITNDQLMNEDERNVCDRYFSSLDKQMSRDMVKEYRQAVRLYRDFVGVSA